MNMGPPFFFSLSFSSPKPSSIGLFTPPLFKPPVTASVVWPLLAPGLSQAQGDLVSTYLLHWQTSWVKWLKSG